MDNLTDEDVRAIQNLAKDEKEWVTCVCVCVYVYVYVYVCVFVSVCMWVCLHVPLGVYVYICISMYSVHVHTFNGYLTRTLSFSNVLSLLP